MIGVYKITNLVNGKVYIGQSKDVEKRLYEHRICSTNVHLRRAIKQYGVDNFSFELLEELSIEHLNERERFWIASLKATDPNFGYNLSSGGERDAGWCHSEESKRKMSESAKKNASKPEYVNPQFETTLIHKGDITTRCSLADVPKRLEEGWSLGVSEDSAKRGANNRRGSKNGFYGKGYLIKGERNPFYGKHHTEETLQRISSVLSDGRLKGENHHMYGKHHSEDSRKKMSESHKGLLVGEKNPNYGKRGKDSVMCGRKAIHKGSVERRVRESELQGYLDSGWELGRIKTEKVLNCKKKPT